MEELDAQLAARVAAVLVGSPRADPAAVAALLLDEVDPEARVQARRGSPALGSLGNPSGSGGSDGSWDAAAALPMAMSMSGSKARVSRCEPTVLRPLRAPGVRN